MRRLPPAPVSCMMSRGCPYERSRGLVREEGTSQTGIPCGRVQDDAAFFSFNVTPAAELEHDLAARVSLRLQGAASAFQDDPTALATPVLHSDLDRARVLLVRRPRNGPRDGLVQQIDERVIQARRQQEEVRRRQGHLDRHRKASAGPCVPTGLAGSGPQSSAPPPVGHYASSPTAGTVPRWRPILVALPISQQQLPVA